MSEYPSLPLRRYGALEICIVSISIYADAASVNTHGLRATHAEARKARESLQETPPQERKNIRKGKAAQVAFFEAFNKLPSEKEGLRGV